MRNLTATLPPTTTKYLGPRWLTLWRVDHIREPIRGQRGYRKRYANLSTQPTRSERPTWRVLGAVACKGEIHQRLLAAS